jgi:hypothetical protein
MVEHCRRRRRVLAAAHFNRSAPAARCYRAAGDLDAFAGDTIAVARLVAQMVSLDKRGKRIIGEAAIDDGYVKLMTLTEIAH